MRRSAVTSRMTEVVRTRKPVANPRADSLSMLGTGILLRLRHRESLENCTFPTRTLDHRTAALSFLVIFTIAMLAAWIPARRAAQINPVTALGKNRAEILVLPGVRLSTRIAVDGSPQSDQQRSGSKSYEQCAFRPRSSIDRALSPACRFQSHFSGWYPCRSRRLFFASGC
jgi:hypothetical protein